MKNDIPVKHDIIIPGHELEITTTRAGGPGGQHVNKTDSRVIIRWNIHTTIALNDIQKERVMQKLHNILTAEGDLIVQNGASRSQQQNKKAALAQVAQIVRTALHVPKKRRATSIPRVKKEARLKAKSNRSALKKIRSKPISDV